NFELIIIDDGSTDDSYSILKRIQATDPRIVLRSRENRGLVETLNEAIGIARGAWIARMDADDIALPYRLERQLNWVTQTNSDLAGSWVQRFGTSDQRVMRFSQSHQVLKMEL